MDRREKEKLAASKARRAEAIAKAAPLRQAKLAEAAAKIKADLEAEKKAAEWGAFLRGKVGDYLKRQEDEKLQRIERWKKLEEEKLAARAAAMIRPIPKPPAPSPPQKDPQIDLEAQALREFLDHPARRFLSRKALDALSKRKETVSELNDLLKKQEFRTELEILGRQ